MESNILNFIKGYWYLVIIAFLSLMVINNCHREELVAVELKSAKEKNQLLEKEKKLFEKSVSETKVEVKKKEVEIEKSKDSLKAKITEIMQFKRKEILRYYKEKYKSESGVKESDSGVVVSDSVSKDIIKDLETGNSCEKELNIVKSILKDEQSISYKKDSIINNLERQNKNLNQVHKKEKRTWIGRTLKIIAFISAGVFLATR